MKKKITEDIVSPDFTNDNNSAILQQKSIKTSGTLNEMHISKNQIMMGLNLNI